MSELSPETELQLRLKGQDDALARIEKAGADTLGQLIKLNGTVKDLSKWKEQVVGASKAVGFCLLLIILPLAGWVLYNQATEPQRINQATKAAVATYFTENYSNVEITK